VFSQFQLHARYCIKITLKSPNPHEISERMNFNVIDKKTVNLKTVYILISDVFHKKMSQSLVKMLISNLVHTLLCPGYDSMGTVPEMRASLWPARKNNFGPVKY
jgi:hypothetical protein